MSKPRTITIDLAALTPEELSKVETSPYSTFCQAREDWGIDLYQKMMKIYSDALVDAYNISKVVDESPEPS
jgi:hypothetical protein